MHTVRVNPKVTRKDVSTIRNEIEVVVAIGDVSEELDAVYRKIGGKAHIKGFRPGKVPRAVLEQYYRQDAESEAIRNLVQKSYPYAIQQVGLMPIATPEIRVTAFGPAQEFSYQAVFEIPPQFEVKGYTGINLTQEPIDVTGAEVQENLKVLQDRMTQLVAATEKRKTRADDIVSMDYQGSLDGKPIKGFEGKDFLVELGKGYLFPEIESALLGVEAGEKKQVSVTLPDTWTDKTLAGKKVDYDLHLKEIKEKKVPELNDDFAKDLGSFTTLEEVKEKIRADVKRAKEQAQRNKFRREIGQKLIEENEFLVPEAMLRLELEDMLRRLEGNLRTQGMTLEQAGVTPQDFAEKNREEALFRVRSVLIFDAIAHKEKISAAPDEIDRRIEEMARLAGQQPAAWKKYFTENNMMGRVEGAILEEKALDFVLSQSKIKMKES